MYLANGTRPDISFAVHYLAKKQLSATEDDWKDVKRMLRYLKGTVNLNLKYTGNSNELEAFSDASFRDNDDSTSSGGYIIRLFGDVIAWRSHKQNYVTLSTCQAEYLAMSDACQEIISLDKAIRYVIGRTLFPTIIWCDNKSADDCIKKDGSHKLKMFDNSVNEIRLELLEREKTGSKKHMAQTHGDFIKQCVNENRIRVCWISTKENLADILTKPLPAEPFRYLRDKLLD
ncbi:secreted RxLR effector protein 161-like [Cotesia glomerata]|uniref:secreted RxLR effector protein 161-like n=1 Tax=Cotesia glomerata TaxID=32391 RepID=UPI001D0335A9|nr:secreted RxLR effector protein 161-like [Cotesia glomerata]